MDNENRNALLFVAGVVMGVPAILAVWQATDKAETKKIDAVVASIIAQDNKSLEELVVGTKREASKVIKSMISGDIKEKDLVNYLIKLDNPDLLTSVTKDLMKVKLFYNGEEKNRADKVIKIISDIKKGRLSTTKNKIQVIYPDKQVASSLMAFLNNNRARV